MKVKAGSSKNKKKTDKTSSPDNAGIPNTENNPRYTIRQISNGWLVDKSWSDKDGKYHSEEIYHEEKPEGLDSMVKSD